MYIKLTINNLRKSLKNYAIYFVTIVIVITLMHGFLVLACSPEILALSENMGLFRNSIFMVTGLASLMIAFVVGNAADFIINQRKKEFAIYYLLGIEKKYINRLFYVENLILYIIALALGILLGKILSGILCESILNVFNVPHKYSVSTSIHPILYTTVFCMLMQLITVFRIITSMKKKNIVNLLYDSHKNEVIKIKNKNFVLLLLVLSISMIGVSVWIIEYALSYSSILAWLYIAIALIVLIFGIYHLYRIFPVMLALFIKGMRNWNYKGTNIFLSKQIISRTNSTGSLMSMVAICLTLSMSIMSMGLAVGAGYKTQIGRYAPYDIAIKIDADVSNFDMELAHIREKVEISDFVNYKIYGSNEYSDMSILALSDYNKIRKQLKLEPVNVEKDKYIIHCEWNYKKQIEDRLKNAPGDVKFGNTVLSPMENAIYTEVMEQRWMVGENGYAMVVSDMTAQYLNTEKSRLIVTAETPVHKELRNELLNIVSIHLRPFILAGDIPRQTTIGVLVQEWTRAHSLTGYTSISFSSIYMGITFTILVCTLLGFQQLAVAEKNKQKYKTLWKVGLSTKTIDKLILKEMLIYFTVPLIMPLIITIMLMVVMNKIYMNQMAEANMIPQYFVLAIALFIIIYAIYFIITFITYRKATLPKTPIRSRDK